MATTTSSKQQSEKAAKRHLGGRVSDRFRVILIAPRDLEISSKARTEHAEVTLVRERRGPRRNGHGAQAPKREAQPPMRASVGTSPMPMMPVMRPAPTTGQSGPPINLPLEECNEGELKVLTLLNGEGRGDRPVLGIQEMTKLGKFKADHWVRNALRDLVRGSWVEKVGRGTYQMTILGRKRLTVARNRQLRH